MESQAKWRSQSGERWFSNAATLYRSPPVTTYPSPLLHLLPTSYKTSAFTFLQPPIFALHLNSLPGLIIRCHARLPVPTLVTYNRSTYSLEDPIETEVDIGPEVTHIYQVFLQKVIRILQTTSPISVIHILSHCPGARSPVSFLKD